MVRPYDNNIQRSVSLKEKLKIRWIGIEILIAFCTLLIFAGLSLLPSFQFLPISYIVGWMLILILALGISIRSSSSLSFIILQFAVLSFSFILTYLYGSLSLFYLFAILVLFGIFERYEFKGLIPSLYVLLIIVSIIYISSVGLEGINSATVGSFGPIRIVNLSILSIFIVGYMYRVHYWNSKSRANLIAKEREIETLFNETPIGLALVDINQSKTAKKVNKALNEVFSINNETALSSNLLELSPERQSNGKMSAIYLTEVLREYRLDKKPIQFEWTINKGDGQRLLEIDLKPFPSAKQSLEILMIRDITEARKAVQLLEESQSLVDRLFDISIDGVEYLIKDTDKNELIHYRSNKNLQKMLGLSNESLKKAQIADISPKYQANGKLSESVMDEVMADLRKNERVKYEWQFIREDGSGVDTEINAVTNFENNIYSYLALFRDITEEKRNQEKIKDQVKKLNSTNEDLQRYIESNLQLENFAYIASHDLKSPIRTIISFSQLLRENLKGQLKEEEKEYLNFIITGSKSMQRLIDDLLRYARVEFSEKELCEFSPKVLIDELLLNNKTEIDDKSAQIKIAKLPEKIFGDKTGMAQVFQNLILNGLKFTKKGHNPIIEIESSEDISHWIFSVKDHGIGIKEEYYERIFLIFKQLHNQEDYDGTGIGLSLCHKICQQHKGKIWVESEYGIGSTFYFSIHKDLGAAKYSSK